MLSEKVMMMPTRPEDPNSSRSSIANEELTLRELTRELEATQRKLMTRRQQLDIAMQKRTSKMTRGGI